tara:strand:+ start:151101 stop:152189 length:1089 start_codon:yes stop_codon:yes gene_type:complete
VKIDFVIGRLKAGGAERVVSLLANYFASKGHTVRIITFIEGDDYKLDPRIERIKLHKKLIVNFVVVRGFFFLLSYYFKKKNRPDIISSHIDFVGYATIIPSKLYKIRVVVSEHFNHLNQEPSLLRSLLWHVLYRLPDAVTVLTKFDIPFFTKKTKRVLVMENPCSFEPIDDLNSQRKKTILTVGNLDRYHHKGFDNLLQIASQVFKNHPDWKLKIVGGGDDGLKILKKMATDLKIEKQVKFLGYRNDIKELMSQAEIYVLSSRHEGLPMVLIEAMSQGMACISYDCVSGPSDIIEHGTNGILVADQNKAAMTTELNKLIDNEDLRQSLRNNSLKSLDKFTMENVGNKWMRLFNDLLDPKKAS